MKEQQIYLPQTWRKRVTTAITEEIRSQYTVDGLRKLIRETKKLSDFRYEEGGLIYRGIVAKERYQTILRELVNHSDTHDQTHPHPEGTYRGITRDDALKTFEYDPEKGTLRHRRLNRLYDFSVPRPYDPIFDAPEMQFDKTIKPQPMDWDAMSRGFHDELASSSKLPSEAIDEICEKVKLKTGSFYKSIDSNLTKAGFKEISNEEYLDQYDPDQKVDMDGTWRASTAHRIKFKGKPVQASKLIWFMQTGEVPEVVTFKEGVNYKWDNLVPLTTSESRRRDAMWKHSGAKLLNDNWEIGDDLFLNLNYCPESGSITYKTTRKYQFFDQNKFVDRELILTKGTDAIIKVPSGHCNVRLRWEHFFYAPVVAWWLYYGEVNCDLEWINDDVSDNRLENLRDTLTGRVGSLNDPKYEPDEDDLIGSHTELYRVSDESKDEFDPLIASGDEWDDFEYDDYNNEEDN